MTIELPKTLTAVKCPCGCCEKFVVSPLFKCACSSLYKEEAEEVVRRWNTLPVIVPKHLEILEWAIDQAEAWKGSLMPDDYPPFEEQIIKAREALEQVKLFTGDPRKVSDPALLRILMDRAMSRGRKV